MSNEFWMKIHEFGIFHDEQKRELNIFNTFWKAFPADCTSCSIVSISTNSNFPKKFILSVFSPKIETFIKCKCLLSLKNRWNFAELLLKFENLEKSSVGVILDNGSFWHKISLKISEKFRAKVHLKCVFTQIENIEN